MKLISDQVQLYFWLILLGFALGGGLMGGWWRYKTSQEYQQAAIERGFAEYDSKTGEWHWKE